MLRRNLLISIAAMWPLVTQAVPFWGAKESLPPETPPIALKQGEFVILQKDKDHRSSKYNNALRVQPVDAKTGVPVSAERLAADEEFRLEPEKAPHVCRCRPGLRGP